jgi:hypothetical protein
VLLDHCAGQGYGQTLGRRAGDHSPKARQTIARHPERSEGSALGPDHAPVRQTTRCPATPEPSHVIPSAARDLLLRPDHSPVRQSTTLSRDARTAPTSSRAQRGICFSVKKNPEARIQKPE